MINKLKDILSESIIIFCGNISKENNFEKIKKIVDSSYFLYEKSCLVLFVPNKKDDISKEEYEKTIFYVKEKIKNCVVLNDHINRSYQIGFIDLDKIAFNYIKYNKLSYKWIIKQMIDILFFEEILNIDIDDECDIQFFPQVSSVESYFRNEEERINHTKNTIYKDIKETYLGCYIMPWFFIIKNSINDIFNTNEEELRKSYKDWVLKINGDLSKWNVQNEILCSEYELVKGFCNKNLKKHCIISEKNLIEYMNFIKYYNIGDGTIKNILLKDLGICHWHFKNSEIVELEFSNE